MVKCVLCDDSIAGDFGKLGGTVLRVKGLDGKNELIHVCKYCQKEDGWDERAKVKGV